MKPAVASLAIAALLIGFAVPAAARDPVGLFRDINPGGSSNPKQLTLVGDTLFFAAKDGVHGVELWKSNGTTAGTKMVKNIRPGSTSSSPQNLIDVNGTLFFTAQDGQHGREWWTSDGTAAGTKLVVDLIMNGSLRIVHPPVAVGSRLFFFDEQQDFSVWSRLYVTDGTAAGTRLLMDESRNADIPYWSTAVTYGGKLYFVARSDNDGLDHVWVSNGTPSGTKQAAWSPAADELYLVPVTGANFYFTTVTVAPGEDPVFRLWKSNGTAAGTRALTSAGELDGAPSTADRAVFMAGRLYFEAGTLWKTNGTVRGTKMAWDGLPYFLATTGDRLFFAAGVDGQGYWLWTSDGTTAGTEPLVGFGMLLPRQLVAFGDEVCFVANVDWDADTWQVWESDGTVGGTYEVASFVNPHATTGDGPMGVVMGDAIYFAADDGEHGVELWRYTH